MSLVLDSLKKIKSGQPVSGASVPPSLLNLAPKGAKKGPSRALLIIFAFVLIGTLIIFFLPSGNDYKVQPPANTGQPQAINAQPQAAAQNPQGQNAPQDNQQPAAQPQQPVAQAAPQQLPSIPVAQPQQSQSPVVQKGQYPDGYTQDNAPKKITLKTLPAITPQIQQNPAQQQYQQRSMPDNGEAAFNAIIQQAQQVQTQQGQQQAYQGQNNQYGYGSQPNYNTYPNQQYAPAVVQRSNPAFTLTGKQKQEYLAKINYNTLTSSAADALNRGNNKKAEQLFAEAMNQRPNRSNLNGLVTSKIRQGDVNMAQTYLKRFPREADTGVICSAASEIARLGMAQRAVALLNQYGSRTGSGQIYYTAGVIMESAGSPSTAESYYERSLRMAPGDPYTLYAAARNKDVLKKYAEAVSLYRKIENIQTDDDLKQNARARAAVLSEYLARQANSGQ